MTNPTIYTHCVTVYEAMKAEAEQVTTKEGLEVQFWEGYTTKLFQSLGLSVPYFTSVTQRLKAMGCIEQIQRGGGAKPSKWQLFNAPTMDLFEQAGEVDRPRINKKPTVSANLQQQINDLHKRLLDAERDIDMLKQIVIARSQKEQ